MVSEIDATVGKGNSVNRTLDSAKNAVEFFTLFDLAKLVKKADAVEQTHNKYHKKCHARNNASLFSGSSSYILQNS